MLCAEYLGTSRLEEKSTGGNYTTAQMLESDWSVSVHYLSITASGTAVPAVT